MDIHPLVLTGDSNELEGVLGADLDTIPGSLTSMGSERFQVSYKKELLRPLFDISGGGRGKRQLCVLFLIEDSFIFNERQIPASLLVSNRLARLPTSLTVSNLGSNIKAATFR